MEAPTDISFAEYVRSIKESGSIHFRQEALDLLIVEDDSVTGPPHIVQAAKDSFARILLELQND